MWKPFHFLFVLFGCAALPRRVRTVETRPILGGEVFTALVAVCFGRDVHTEAKANEVHAVSSPYSVWST